MINTEELEEYCKNRNLVLVGAEVFNHLTSRVDTAEARAFKAEKELNIQKRKYTEAEQQVLSFMFSSVRLVLQLGGSTVNVGGDGVCYFDENDLYDLADKIGVDNY